MLDFSTPFWIYWYYHIPNYLLSALMWTCYGRFLLGFFVQPNSQNYIWRFFVRVTEPTIRLVRHITPGFVLDVFLPLVAGFWILVARYLLQRLMVASGLLPATGFY